MVNYILSIIYKEIHYNAEFDGDGNLIIVEQTCNACGVSKSIKAFPKLW